MKTDNFNAYWRRWNVLQTPKINFDIMHVDGWEVYDLNLTCHGTMAIRGDISIIVEYLEQGGVQCIRVKKDNVKELYSKRFSFIIKPSVSDIQKVLEVAGITDWMRYFTAC